jgi:hypothetical protein
MFKHPKLVSSTAAKLDPKQQSKEEPIPPIGAILQIAFRQMLESAQHHDTQVLQKKPQHRASRMCRGKILYMPKRSPADSCNT